MNNEGDDGGNDNSGRGSESRRPLPEFVGTPGCTHDMTNKYPIDFFQLLITTEMLEAIVEQTNLCAQQFMDSHELTRRSRVQQWPRSPHDVAELKKFLALVIIMGLVSYPSTEDCWVTSWPFCDIHIQFHLEP